jgi:hypothetical protein
MDSAPAEARALLGSMVTKSFVITGGCSVGLTTVRHITGLGRNSSGGEI